MKNTLQQCVVAKGSARGAWVGGQCKQSAENGIHEDNFHGECSAFWNHNYTLLWVQKWRGFDDVYQHRTNRRMQKWGGPRCRRIRQILGE